MDYDPYAPPKSSSRPESAETQRSQISQTGLALGLGTFGMIAWLMPICGAPISICGLILGIKGLSGPKSGVAVVAVVLCAIGLGLSLINGVIGAQMAMNGQNELINQLKGQ